MKRFSNSDLIFSLKYKESFLKYLDRTGNLVKIKEAAEKYKKCSRKLQKHEEYSLPFLFSLDIDVVLLCEIAATFTSFFLSEPDLAQYFIHEVVHCSATTLADIPDLELQDVQVFIRVQSFPPLPGLIKAAPGKSSGLVLLQGVLVAQTIPTKYTRSAVFRCPNSRCLDRTRRRVKGNMVQYIPRCVVCSAEMKEICRARDTGDQVMGLLITPSAFENSSAKPFLRHQGTLVCFQDDLITNLQLGERYDVPGVQINAYFLAWNVHRWISDIHSKMNHPGCPSLPLPPSISNLYAHLSSQCCPNSPWASVAALAAQIAADIFPPTALLHLKLGLLLSLASQGGNHPPVPILAVGPDTLAAHNLLYRGSLLAQRQISLSSSSLWSPFHSTAYHDDQGNCWIEAGALALASTGVCFLGDWTKFKSNNLHSAILSAIESGQVTPDIQKIPLSRAAVVSLKLPLKCAVWTYKFWTHGEKESEQIKLQTLINVFGMPFLADLGSEEDKVFHGILQEAINMGSNTGKPYCVIPNHELREYLAMVTAQPVKIGDGASQLIQDYFVASRRLRSHCLPVGAVSTITALSEAHAKLAMRHIVSCEDVAVVLYLYEKALVSLYGSYYVTPPPELNVVDAKDLPVQIHEHMTQFVAWLDKHIKLLLGDSSFNLQPEE